MRILLAEDNAGDVFLVRRALEKSGLQPDLTVVRNGEEALHVLAGVEHGSIPDAPELILLDLNLPKLDGRQVLRYIRCTQTFARTPVIILTSSDSLQDRETMISLGADSYFRKPMDLNSFMELGRLIEETLKSTN